jgi:hypothetical protein
MYSIRWYALGFTTLVLLSACIRIPMLKRNSLVKPVEQPFALSPQPPDVDYSNEANWAALPWRKDMADSLPQKIMTDGQQTAAVDVFFIHPTTYTGSPTEWSFYWNADVNNSTINKKTDEGSILYQSSVFNESCRVFAPRYRQAHISAFYTQDQQSGNAALELAYQDIRKAFEYFLKHYSKNRPFIIAGHSQGTRHAGKLLRELVENDATLSNRLVASYLVGMPVPVKYFQRLPLCDDPDDIGCFVSWCTFQEGFYPPNYTLSGYPNVVCVNPLSWKADTLNVHRNNNLGGIAWNFSRIIPKINNARIHNGMLWIEEPRVRGRMFINMSNYHIADYNLFWLNIRENVKQRCAMYFKQQAGGAMPQNSSD